MSEQMKPDLKKVVPLRPEGRSERQAAAPEAAINALPAILRSLHERAQQRLRGMLRELFNKADDTLFELADKAASNQDQNLYFDGIRELRLGRRPLTDTFFHTIDQHFACLLGSPAEGNGAHSVFSSSEWEVVENEQLDEMMAIEAMVHKLEERSGEAIQHLTLRIDQLVPVKVYHKNNPLGAVAISEAFALAARKIPLDGKIRLVLFKLFEQCVMAPLDGLLNELNQLLIDANILPSLRVGSSGAHGGKTVGANRLVRAPGATSTSKSTSGFSRESDNRDLVDDEQARQLLQGLRELLGPITSSSDEPAAPVTAVATTELLQWLSRAQHQQAQQPVADVREWVQGILQSNDKAARLSALDDDVINLVGMMFEFILDDRTLAAPMKALIGRLQIPLIKVAVADKTFFGQGGHPARRLLNEMALAALGWQETPEELTRKNGLYEYMQAMVENILQEFETDLSLFERQLFAFRVYLDKERHRAQILEQRAIDAEDGKAKAELARRLVKDELKKICAGRELPQVVSKILHEAWANVMFIHCLREGVESQAWRDCCTSARQLVWSVSSAVDDKSRQQLVKLVPELLRRLRIGLDSISFSPFETAQLLKQLQAVHLLRLRADHQEAAAAPEPASPPPKVTAQGADNELGAADSALTPTLTPAAPANSAFVLLAEPEVAVVPAPDSQHLSLVGNLTQGTWFEMQGDNGTRYRCRLAAVIRAANKYIFVNRAGIKVAEETRESFALALQQKRLHVLDDGMLFDRALESVIANLREQRSQNE